MCDIALLQQQIGLAKAKEVILTGRPLPSRLSWKPDGLLNAILFRSDQLLSETRRMLARAAGQHAGGDGGTEEALRVLAEPYALTAAIDMSVDVFAECVRRERKRTSRS